MSIRLKIFLGYLVIFLIFGGAIYYIVSALRTIPPTIENLESRAESLTIAVSLSGLIAESQILRSDMERLTARYLISPQDSVKAEYESNLNSLEEVLAIAIERTTRSDSPERDLFTSLESINSELISLEQLFFSTAGSGSLQGARSGYLGNQYRSLSQSYFSELSKYSVHQTDAGNDVFSSIISSFDAVNRENQEILRINRLFIIIVIVAGILVFFFAGIFSHSVGRPIMLLTRTAEKISRGDTLARAPILSHDETGKLAESFNRMAGSLVNANKQTKQALDLSKHNENLLQASVSALEKTRAELEAQVVETKKFAQAVEFATDGVAIVRPKGDIIYVNPAWERLTGYSASEVLDKKPSVLNNTKTDKNVYAQMWDTLATRKPYITDEIADVKKSGEEYQVQLAIFPIVEGGATKFYVLVEQDITERKEIDRAKTEFVSLASHQLRTPLSATSWYTELLIDGGAGELNDKQRKYLNEIHRSNKNMIELVSTLLNVSRIELGTLKVDLSDVDPVALIKAVIADEKAGMEKDNIKLISDISEDVPKIKSDKKLLRMIFQNLLSNAVKYTLGAGTVTVKLAKNGSGGVQLSIADTGIGIPKKAKSKIFTKMFRADNVKEKKMEGTGLGLYIVKSVTEYFGGKIWFESEENKGTTFYVTLPSQPSSKKVDQKKSPI